MSMLGANFVEVLERVPHLLYACINTIADEHCIGGLKVVRLITKTARTITLKAVTSYTLSLTPQSEGIEPLSEVAKLLQYTQLRCLRVHVILPLDATDFPENLSAIQRLNKFICDMGSSLKLVKELELKISTSKLDPKGGSTITPTISHLDAVALDASEPDLSSAIQPQVSKANVKTRGKGKNNSSSGKKRKRKGSNRTGHSSSQSSMSKKVEQSPEPPSEQALMISTEGAGLAGLLAAACPELTSLIISEGVGCAALEVFGLKCSKINSLEVNHQFISAKELKTAIVQKMLSNLTHARMTAMKVTSSSRDAAKRFSIFCVLCQCPSLTSFCGTDGVLYDPAEWQRLPPGIQHITCHNFPPLCMTDPFPLVSLVSLEICHMDYGLTGTSMYHLLNMAPNLMELRGSHSLLLGGNHVSFNKLCSIADLAGWVFLHRQEKAGLKMTNMSVSISSVTSQEADIVSLDDALLAMKEYPVSFFTNADLTNQEQEEGSNGYVPHLALVGTVFPGLQILALYGISAVESLGSLRCGSAMKRLMFHDVPLPLSCTVHFTQILQFNPMLVSIEFPGPLGHAESNAVWVRQTMKEHFTPPPGGWDALRFCMEDWIIQISPGIESGPIREIQYHRMPNLK